MRLRLENFSISKQLIALVLGVGGVIAITTLLYNSITMAYHEKRRFLQETMMEGKLVSDLSISPVAFDDPRGATDNLLMLASRKPISQAVLFDKNKKFFAQYNPDNLPKPTLAQLTNGFVDDDWFSRDSLYRLYTPIIYKNETIGYLYLQKKASNIFSYSIQALGTSLAFSLFAMMIFFLIAAKVGQIILRPVLSLVESTKHVAMNQDYAVRVHYSGNNEIAQLYNALNLLLKETQELTVDLESRVDERTQELSSSLEELKAAQEQLIEAEKMSALGNLVSGVAHEVNTPLGNAITGGSIILRESKNIQESLGDGSLKRSVMEEKLGMIIESATLMIKSLNNAADLVKNFKRISVDQSIDDLRDFDIRGYIDTIIQTYHNKLKHEKVSIEIISDPTVTIYSYPGSFAQIINNLINNALLHAFEGKTQEAKITIEIQKYEEYLMLSFGDNGVGVDEKILPNIFEPFVTSKRNAGGTGLGMNIIYNIVTQKLKGTIRVASQINRGTVFKIRLPYLERKTVEDSEVKCGVEE